MGKFAIANTVRLSFVGGHAVGGCPRCRGNCRISCNTDALSASNLSKSRIYSGELLGVCCGACHTVALAI